MPRILQILRSKRLALCGHCAICALIAVMGLLVLIGWWTKTEALIRISPNFVAMQFNTALMFIFSSVALILAMKGVHRWAMGVAAFVILFSAVTFAQYPLDMNFGLDELFIEAHTVFLTTHAGRMAPNTAIAFVLVGISAVLMACRQSKDSEAVIPATLALAISILALYSYIARTENAYGWGGFTRMALHTSFGFFVLSLVTLLEIWRRSRFVEGSKRLPGWLAFVSSMIALSVGLCAWNSVQIIEEKRSNEETQTLAGSVQRHVAIALAGDYNAIVRMADRFEIGMRGDSWIDDADNYLNDIEGLWAVAFYDESLNRKRIVIHDESRREETWNLKARSEVLDHKERTAIRLDPGSGSSTFLISIRVAELNAESPAGYIVGFFDAGPFFENAIGAIGGEIKTADYLVMAPDGDILASSFSPDEERGDRIRVDISDPEHPWTMEIYASPTVSLTDLGVRLSSLMLIAAFVIAGLIYWIVAFACKTYNLRLLRTDTDVRQANEELETLLYIISHDLQEPIRSITSFANILEEDYQELLPPPGIQVLARIQAGGERLQHLLADVATISRAQRLDIPDQSISLQNVVRSQIEALKHRIDTTGAKVHVAHGLPSVRAEELWVGHAVNNLISNALKFTNPGQPAEIDIEPYHGPEGKGIVVKDRGTGLPKNSDERLYDLFRRGVGRGVEGTGVGLAIVKKVAQKHGGKTWFHNRPGGGAAFYITLGGSKK